MAILKCKMCGSQLETAGVTSVCFCEFCGSGQALPTTVDDNILVLFNSANDLRMKNEFDKAAETYEKILKLNSTEAEAYWGLLLCRYGIKYEEDPATYKRVPVCCRESYNAITADADYMKAIQYADSKQRAMYEEEAKAIQAIQKIVARENNSYNQAQTVAGNTDYEYRPREQVAKKPKNKNIIVAVAIALVAVIAILFISVIAPMNKYNNAMKLKESGDYEQAIKLFAELKDYKDAEKQATETELMLISKASVNDYVFFGTVLFEKNKAQWKILDKRNGKALLIRKEVVGSRSYNDEYDAITWDDCSLREWLNGEYIRDSFNKSEQARIIPTEIINAPNAEYHTFAGNNTTDRVFLLSIDEANKYFRSDEDRKAHFADGKSVSWWLRSPGQDNRYAANVDYDGKVHNDGNRVDWDGFIEGVRPAIWVDISNP